MLFPASERRAELEEKRRVLQGFLAANGLDAYLISRHENVAWTTAGMVDMHVGLLREVGVGSLLIQRDGPSHYITTENEAPRLAAEEFAHLEYQPIVQPWYANDVQGVLRKIVPSGRIAADDSSAGLPFVSMKLLRVALTDGEIARYRWLGARVADVATDALLALRPGVSEAKMQAMVGERLLTENIQPSVFLMAVDERIRRYRHAVPRDGMLQRFGMLNFCARRWGLCISITRFVHFGAMPGELEGKFTAVEQVNARLLHATREGATAGDLFSVAKRAYAELGYAGEEQMHHQGGATGYWEREWVARPSGEERVLARQAMAWNPTIQGAKIEDTVLSNEQKIETLTATPRLPVVETPLGGVAYRSAGVLLA
jgi:Xaa-Pro dipeptidase